MLPFFLEEAIVKFFMSLLMKIDHIGIAVSDLAAAIEIYKNLGMSVEHMEEVSEMKVKVAFLPVGESRLELLESLSSDSVISKFISKRGEGVHHICFEVKDIHKAVKTLRDKKIEFIYPEPKKGSENSLVTFIHPKFVQGVLIELRQKG